MSLRDKKDRMIYEAIWEGLEESLWSEKGIKVSQQIKDNMRWWCSKHDRAQVSMGYYHACPICHAEAFKGAKK